LFNADVGYVYPHRCWSCLVPCFIREDFVCDEVDGQIYTYCSETCRWTHKTAFAAEYQGRPTPAMGRFSGRREWETCYDGWDVADAIKDLGFVRSDGQTLIGQPHLHFDDKKMWKLEHVRGDILLSPLRMFRELRPEQREVAAAEYRKGFTINACN
jgi:propane monooxygenase large subunit